METNVLELKKQKQPRKMEFSEAARRSGFSDKSIESSIKKSAYKEGREHGIRLGMLITQKKYKRYINSIYFTVVSVFVCCMIAVSLLHLS